MESENDGTATLKPLINLLRDSEVNGSTKRSKISQALPRRFYPLGQIVPSEEVLSHIFLGFTRDGQYLLSYRFVGDTMYFYIWHFNPHGPLKLVSEHIIFISSNNLTTLPQVEYLYESTAIHVYQWPRDDKHLLILTIPESLQPSVINLVCIHVDRKRSHILQPGLITLSVVDWKYKLSAAYRQNKVSFNDYLSPGLLLFGPSVCTFHTGTEIIFLEIKKPETKGECCKVNNTVLDIEQVLAETLDKKHCNNFIGLSNYEVLVFGISPSKPSRVYAFILAIIREPCDGQSVLEFKIVWNPDKGNYDVTECTPLIVKKSSLKSKDKSETQAQRILRRLIESLRTRENYSLNNIQLLETQTSFDALNSPVDNVSVILSLS